MTIPPTQAANPVTPAPAAGQPATGAATAAASAGSINQTDFLKLLTGQLKNQDPMQPTDDSAWISEMAQFSMVQQVTSMTQSNNKILGALNTSQTLSLIGHTVTYNDSSGSSSRGTVEQVDMAGGSATLTINGQAGIAVSGITQVQ